MDGRWINLILIVVLGGIAGLPGIVGLVLLETASGDSPGAGNGVFQVSMEDAVGRDGVGVFTIATGTEHPDGWGREVLFGEDAALDPATSYVTLRSYTTGTDYVQTRRGPASGFLVRGLDALGAVEQSGLGYEATYDLAGGAQPDQLVLRTSLGVGGQTVDDAYVRLFATVENKGSFPVDAGLRFLVDLAPYGDDGPAMVVPGSNTVDVFEAEIKGDSPVQFWSAAPHAGPEIEIVPIGGRTAERAVYAYWTDSFRFAWDYAVRQRRLAGDGGLNDVAVLYYFGATRETALHLDPGGSITVALELRQALRPAPAGGSPTPAVPSQQGLETPTPTPAQGPVALPRTGRSWAGNAGAQAGSLKVSLSPSVMPAAIAVPAGSSRAFLPPPPRAMRQGLIACTIFTTTSSRSRKRTSMGNRMKNMWMEEQGVMRMPFPDGSSRRPMSPQNRDQGSDAICTRSAMIAPAELEAMANFIAGSSRTAGEG